MPDSAILFTAFETSGDALAGPVIAALKERLEPDVRLYACGGPKMAEAGATLLHRTDDLGAMGLSALGRVAAFRDVMRRSLAWAADHRVVGHIAVDSPAANFPLAARLRRRGARVVHLVAPQLWAWAPWRAAKLRRLTSCVLCVLPFEEEWFRRRRIPARFIGHPAFNRPDAARPSPRVHSRALPGGRPRIVLLPGSREHEVRANLPLLLEVFTALGDGRPELHGVAAAASEPLAGLIRAGLGAASARVDVQTGVADAAIAWADLALAVSGTVTLDIARQGTPMVAVYRTGRFAAGVARVLVRAPDRILPNIVAGRRIVPEFVPWAGGAEPVIAEARRLLDDEQAASAQRAELAGVCRRFQGHDPASEAASAIVEVLGAKG